MSQISKAAAALGKRGGSVSSAAKTAAVRLNAQLGGRPSTSATYTVREPGASYWWQGNRLGDARKQLAAAKAAGLRHATIYAERDGKTEEII